MTGGDVTVVKVCRVVSVLDDFDGNRIKVRMMPDDGSLPIEELPYAIPLLPQLIHVKPKVGEYVLMLNAVANNGKSQRYYIGPLISQVNHMYFEPWYSATNLFETSTGVKDVAQTRDVNKTYGATPREDEIALIGRKMSDIILSDNDLRIRCGAKKVSSTESNTFTFNAVDSAYIKLEYYENGLENNKNCNSTATIVADRINLIGNKSKERNGYMTNNPDGFIDNENMAKLIQAAHVLPYGDKLVEFLELFRKVFMEHTHPFPMLPPCQPDEFKNMGKYDLKKILSESVRIN